MLPDRNKVMAVQFFAACVRTDNYAEPTKTELRSFCAANAHDFGLLDYNLILVYVKRLLEAGL